MQIQERLKTLRRLMAEKGIDCYIIPSSDPHQNEYIPACWQLRSWFSGFTGTAGSMAVTKDFAGLWTDSRYFIQAEKQLEGTGISLFKLIIPHTPEHIPWLAKHLPPSSTLAIDDRFFSTVMFRYIQDVLVAAGHKLAADKELLNPLWPELPKVPVNPVFTHHIKYAGLSRREKISRVLAEIKELGAEYHLITTLDDIAWLLNLRGNDISFCPFFISYCIVSVDGTYLFIDQDKVPSSVSEALAADAVELHPYGAVSGFLKSLPEKSTIYLSPEKVNHALVQSIPSDVNQNHGMNITTKLKAIKNEVEIEGLQRVMVKDGIAWVKTLHWIDHQIQSGAKESEWSVALKIAEFRSDQQDYQGESFHPISSYGWHGAVVHYSVTPEESLNLKPEGVFLLDSGGHYLDGTTDTTRTIALSTPDNQQKSLFTRALKGTLAISMLRFPKGTKGYQMDILARKSLWDIGLNYGHGTGHGVGFFGSVHEGPQTIGTSASGYQNVALEPGMVTTVEPGIYQEGCYGMRTENMTLVVEDLENDYGVFYRFETLTLAPIDRRLIDHSLLSQTEIEWLNAYHLKVYTKLSAYLTDDERIWLEQATNSL